jgi:hypothetical protein
MIVANTRQRLTRNDAQLALRLVARGSASELERVEDALRNQGIDALLDDARLLAALLQARQGAHASLPLFSYVVARHALREVGEDDRVLADFVASILLHFGLRDRATRIADADDEIYTTLADLAAAVENSEPSRSFLVRAHLGNYALWLSGVFPDYIETRRYRRGGPDLDYYEEMGRRGYRLAADHRLAAEHGVAALYALAAERFPVLRQALNDISDRLLFPHHHSPEKLMRQVRNEARYLLS